MATGTHGGEKLGGVKPAREKPARSWKRWLFPVGAVGLIVAAILSPAFLLNTAARLQPYDVAKDIAYADGSRRRLDVYRPSNARQVPIQAPIQAPVIVFFYGGSWQTGSKETYLFLAATLAARGFVVIVPDYRVYPEVKFPDFLGDGAKAVRWAKDNAAAYGGDPSRVFIMGHSAGAYIAAMLTIDEQWLHGVGLDPLRDVVGLIGVSGPYDFLPLKDEVLKTIFGGDRQPQTQPITFAVGRKPPALLITGAGDDVVNPGNSTRLADKLRSQGNTATDTVYARFGHTSILLSLAPFLAERFALVRDIDAFTARTRTANAGGS